jgi:hypothetical protein
MRRGRGKGGRRDREKRTRYFFAGVGVFKVSITEFISSDESTELGVGDVPADIRFSCELIKGAMFVGLGTPVFL